METIRIERDLDPEIKRIVTEIACIMGRQDKKFARGVLAYAMGRDGAAPARNSPPMRNNDGTTGRPAALVKNSSPGLHGKLWKSEGSLE